MPKSQKETHVPRLAIEIPASLNEELNSEAVRSARKPSSIVVEVLAKYFEKPVHTVFQVSTSGALVAGVYDREVSVQKVLEHGDFGLGTFANLDGEMIVVDGAPIRYLALGWLPKQRRMPACPLRLSPGSSPRRRRNSLA
jgi:acetolactate decarboxylase